LYGPETANWTEQQRNLVVVGAGFRPGGKKAQTKIAFVCGRDKRRCSVVRTAAAPAAAVSGMRKQAAAKSAPYSFELINSIY